MLQSEPGTEAYAAGTHLGSSGLAGLTAGSQEVRAVCAAAPTSPPRRPRPHHPTCSQGGPAGPHTRPGGLPGPAGPSECRAPWMDRHRRPAHQPARPRLAPRGCAGQGVHARAAQRFYGGAAEQAAAPVDPLRTPPAPCLLPAGRVGRPEDVAAMCLFLADGQRAGFITGAGFVCSFFFLYSRFPLLFSCFGAPAHGVGGRGGQTSRLAWACPRASHHAGAC